MSLFVYRPSSRFPALWRISVFCLLACMLLTLDTFTAHGKGASMRDRNYYVRIAIAKEAKSAGLMADRPYYVKDHSGRHVGTLQSGETYTVKISKGIAGGYIYRLVINELNPHQTENAKAMAKGAEQAYGLPAKPIIVAGETEDAPKRLLVTLGEFLSSEEARGYRDSIGADNVKEIFREQGPVRQAGIALVHKSGTTVASDGYRLHIEPVDPINDSIYFQKLSTSKSLGFTKSKAAHYRGKIVLAVDKDGTMTAVNHLWVEYYIYGVVAAEIGNFAPMEALKAQAVAARSEAVAKIERGIVSGNPLYDFEDTAIFQAYKGKGKENANVRRAVDATRGEILVYNDKPVDAVYSHSCGGVISSMADHWDTVGAGYSVRVADTLKSRTVPPIQSHSQAYQWTGAPVNSVCNPNQKGFPKYARGHYRWSKTYDASSLDKLFAYHGVGRVKAVRVAKRSASGRVRDLEIVGSKRTIHFRRELAIRRALGNVKSTFFTISTSSGSGGVGTLTIKGAGFGHGVGMCQMGAYMLAVRKYNYRQILGFYFKSVKIRRLYG